MRVSRREFLNRIGAAGGLGAVHAAMQALGLSSPSAYVSVPPLRKLPRGSSIRVVVLGAGIAGLVAAYEMRRAGWSCVVLEALAQPGGRSRTIRRGTIVQQEGDEAQHCELDGDLYFNAGAARIPGDHRAVLHYCRELHVPLETAVTRNSNAYIRAAGTREGKAIRQHEVAAATRGAIDELLSKSFRSGALDQHLTHEDRERIVEFLEVYAGRTAAPRAERLYEMLDVSLWRWLALEYRLPMAAATMLQPVGGMDRIASMLAARIAPDVRYGVQVRSIRHESRGVRVVYRDLLTGGAEHVEADYCLCTIPWPALRSVAADFSPVLRAAISAAAFESATKIAWQAPRFWEREDRIFGGVSYTGDMAAMLWYPSEALNEDTGVLVGAYTTGIMSQSIAAQPLAKRYEISRAAVEKLHPGKGRALNRPVAVSWCLNPWSRGAWSKGLVSAHANPSQSVSDGRVYFAGDQLSELSGWQEGAVLSAHRSIAEINRRIHEAP